VPSPLLVLRIHLLSGLIKDQAHQLAAPPNLHVHLNPSARSLEPLHLLLRAPEFRQRHPAPAPIKRRLLNR
jgi:hypothetical protein